MTQIYVTSEEEVDSPESRSLDKLITFSNENDVTKRTKVVTSSSTTTATKKKNPMTSSSASATLARRNRVNVAAEFQKASEEDLRSAKGVRRLRKKVALTYVRIVSIRFQASNW